MRTGEIIANLACWAIQTGKDHKLRPENQETLKTIARKIANGQRTCIDEIAQILKGYEVEVCGLENGNYLQTPSLVIVNHTDEGPARNIGHEILIINIINRISEEAEGLPPSFIMGKGFSFVSSLRQAIQASTQLVTLVNGDHKGRSTDQVFDLLKKGRPAILAPEGENSSSLKQADFRAGRLAFHVAEEGYPIVPMSTRFEKSEEKYYMAIGKPVDNQRIIYLGNSSLDKRVSGQRVIDDVMGGCLSPLLPPSKRGYYASYSLEKEY